MDSGGDMDIADELDGLCSIASLDNRMGFIPCVCAPIMMLKRMSVKRSMQSAHE
jgi:hypothetical protein